MTKADRIILLTGFGPFPGVQENASAMLVPALAARARTQFPGFTIVDEILDTAWSSAPARAAALIRELKPLLALHFGVAGDATGFRLERLAHNVCRAATDATGCLPLADQLDACGPPSRSPGLDIDSVAADLAAYGFPVSLSDDAGAYLCNAVLYNSLAAAEALATTACRSIFVHIPHDLSGPPLGLTTAVDGGLEIIRACLMQIAAQR